MPRTEHLEERIAHLTRAVEDLSDIVRAQGQQLDRLTHRLRLLSEREAEVFELVALGYRNAEIADKLALSVKTVETYKSRMMDKLGLQTRTALVRFALELGMLQKTDPSEVQ